MELFLLTFITRIDQMVFLEEHLWCTASAITKIEIKNIIGASFTADIWKIISKNIS